MQKVRTIFAIAAGLSSAPLVGGCTIIYNTDDLHTDAAIPDATTFDAGPDAAPADADVMQPTLTAVSPSSVTEGVGSATGARPALIVLTGQNLVNEATVTVAWAAPTIPGSAVLPVVVHHVSSRDLKSMVVELAVPVNDQLAAGETHDLIITVTNNGASVTQSVSIVGLDELTIDSATSAQQLATASATTYSKITLAGQPTALGTAAVILHATGNIAVQSTFSVSASGQTAGPGGCDGGAAQTDASCTENGGKAGMNRTLTTGTGGGGGGYATMGTTGGTTGSNNLGGAGGAQSGDSMLVPLGVPTGSGTFSRAGGGGGGGGSTSIGTNGGGVGGGGGGSLALWTDGAITIAANGGLTANGAAGTTSGSTGGGGAGGGILLHAGAGITSAKAAPWATATGGGNGQGTATATTGGAGSNGRVRVDTPTPLAATLSSPPAVAGPAWAASAPVTSAGDANGMISLELHGTTGHYGIEIDGHVGNSLSDAITSDGVAEVEVPVASLTVGVHTVCAIYTSSGDGTLQLGAIEDQSCIDIAYLP